jgi:hypothetical protein
MDSTARYLASVYDKLPPEDGRLLLQFAEFLFEKQPRVINAREARRQVSAWLVREVGNLLMGGQPEFVPGDQPVWRVPVIVAGSPDQLADSINVDARSGELLVNESTPGHILSHVQFAVSHTAPN